MTLHKPKPILKLASHAAHHRIFYAVTAGVIAFFVGEHFNLHILKELANIAIIPAMETMFGHHLTNNE